MKYEIISSEALLSSKRWDPAFFMQRETNLDARFTLVALSELVDERKSFLEPQKYKEHCFNYIGLENIAPKTRVLVDFKPKLGVEIKSRSKIYRYGDVLYGRMRPTLNKVLSIGEGLNEGICSTEIFVLSPKKDVINKYYLEEILSSIWVQSQIERLVGGATMPRVSIKDFLTIKVPLPPKNIQDDIGSFVFEKREEWEKYAKSADIMPSKIANGIQSFLQHEECLGLMNIDETLSSWDNPLPDLELK